jgi:nucleotide-binding universal stress UspA family protein
MKVLVGVGGSDDGLRALDRAVERARVAGDDLTVAVIEGATEGADADDVVERVRETLAAASVDAEVRRLAGDPGSALVDLAESEGFDRIAIGGGSRSPMGKITLGPVAEFVLLNSHVTVTLVR